MIPGCVACAMALAPIHISVARFGAHPGSLDDAGKAVARAIDAAHGRPAILDFPRGELHFYRSQGIARTLYLSNTTVDNPRRIAILLDHKSGIRLQGHHTRLVFHDRIIPIAILGGSKDSVEGFEIDWARPLMSQGKVLSADSRGVTLEIDAHDYRYNVRGDRLRFEDKGWEYEPSAFMEFDPATRGVAYGTGDAGCLGDGWEKYTAHPIPGRGRGNVTLTYPFKRLPKVGNILVARHGPRDHCGAFVQDARDVTFSNIAFRQTPGLGVLCQYSTNLTFRHVEFAPAPGSERIFSGHDDGIHVSNCRGHVEIDDCRFEGLMDDPINVHGTAVRITSRVNDTTFRCRFMHEQSVGLLFGNPGDRVSFLDHATMASRGIGRIRQIRHLSERELEVEFASATLPTTEEGDALENVTWTPSLTVRRCEFGGNRARGLLVSTHGHVLVEGCTFRTSGAAILIAGDANYWYESGAVRDVTIKGNLFENCLTSTYQFCDAIISIHPEIPTPGQPFHRNIRIEGNVFLTFDRPVLWAKSVEGLSFNGNLIKGSSRFKPWHPNHAGLTFEDCTNVTVAGNLIGEGFLGRSCRQQGRCVNVQVQREFREAS